MKMDETLDLRGLKCPLPALLAKKAVAKLASGMGLRVLADDPLSVVDIPYMCSTEGHLLKEQTTQDGHHAFVIRRA